MSMHSGINVKLSDGNQPNSNPIDESALRMEEQKRESSMSLDYDSSKQPSEVEVNFALDGNKSLLNRSPTVQ